MGPKAELYPTTRFQTGLDEMDEMSEPTVELYMTVAPHTIQQDQSLADARDLMRAHRIRHLPVLDGSRLIGLVSQRDLLLLQTLEDVDPQRVAVREAMTENTYAIGRDATVRTVAADMADHRYGSAIVVDRGQVIGIFTAIDGLRALSLLLSQRRQARH
jgi:acetoin utilization protein AcuB